MVKYEDDEEYVPPAEAFDSEWGVQPRQTRSSPKEQTRPDWLRPVSSTPLPKPHKRRRFEQELKVEPVYVLSSDDEKPEPKRRKRKPQRGAM